MKNTTLFITLFTISVANVFSQKNSFCLDVGVHGNLPDRLFNSSIPKSNPKNGGLGAQVMPMWNRSNHISYGINLEFTYLTTNAKYDVYHKLNILSVSPTFKYTFTDHTIRPFVGSGMGVYHVFNYAPVLNLGVKPFVGVSVKDVFNVSFEFTQILSTIKENPNKFIGFNEYFVAVKGSFCFGLKNATGKIGPSGR
jgi:hypothetical protein